MATRCDRCAILKRIEGGEQVDYAELRATCSRCKDPYSLSHGGVTFVEATEQALARRVPDSGGSSSGVDGITPEKEEQLRFAMEALFGLDPIDLLLVQHIVNGGRMNEFGEVFSAIADRASQYRGRVGAMAAARKDAICRRFSLIAPALQGLVASNNGKLVRVERRKP